MQQVVIAMRRGESEAVITALQEAGVLHLKPIQGGELRTGSLVGEDAERRREDERLLARVESTLAELGTQRAAPAALPTQGWSELVEAAAVPTAELAKRRQAFQSDLDTAQGFGGVVQALAALTGGLDRSKRLAVLPFAFPAKESSAELEAALKEALPERYEVALQDVGTQRVGVIATLKGDRETARNALSKVRMGELRLPGRFDGMPYAEAAAELEQVSKQATDRQLKLASERDRLSEQHGGVLYALRDALKDRVAIHDVRTVSARGKYSFVMQGYVPEDRVVALKSVLDRFGSSVSYEVHPVDEHHDHDIPVELQNSSYATPFQNTVVGLMSLPKYGTFDPTPIVAVFVPFFFGIIMADIGYGLLFLAAGMWLLGKAKRGEGLDLSMFGAYLSPAVLRDLGFVTNVMAAWTILWGFLTGEFFGTLFENMHIFYINAPLLDQLWGWTGLRYPHVEGVHHHGLIPIVFPRLETTYFSNVALVFSLLFGILQVMWGWGIRMQQGIKHKDQLHIWEGIAMLGGVGGLVLMAFATKAAKDFGQLSNFTNPLVLLMYVGFAVFVVGYAKVAKQLPLLFIELLSQGGAIVSYSRLFAVGLVSAILAKLCTNLGWSMYESMGIIGIILGIIVGVGLHALVLVLTLIGHILQPIRLHLVEFLNPTGFNSETSPRYNPLRRLSSVHTHSATTAEKLG